MKNLQSTVLSTRQESPLQFIRLGELVERCDSTQEEKLIIKVIQGCCQSFETLVKTHQPQLKKFINQKVQSQDIADDLLQDTLLKAYINITKFRKQSQFSTWVTGIAINEIRNHYNRSPEYRYDFVDDSILEYKASEQNVELSAIFEDNIKHIFKTLDQLPEETKAIFEGAIIEQTPYAEIAKQHDLSVNNVKVRIHRVRKALADTLENAE